MPSLTEKIRSSSSSLINKIRGFSSDARNWRQTQSTPPFASDLSLPEIDLTNEINELNQKGYSQEKIMKAIESAPEIKDKNFAIRLLQKIIPSRTITIEIPKPKEQTGEFSAYNPVKSQTDNTPTIMASGKKIYEGAIASGNRDIPFGTKVYIPELNKTFTVEDRMNERYDQPDKHYFDILMKTPKEAKEFGRKQMNFIIQK